MVHRLRVFVLTVTTALAAIAAAEAATPKKTTTKPAGGKKITFQVKQADAFVALARKAAALKGVHMKGRFEMLSAPRGMPANMRKMPFETWTTPTRAKSVTHQGRAGTWTVYDGKHVYSFGAPNRGRRAKLTRENFYRVLEIASINFDAAQGYANLGNAVKFAPIPTVDEYDKKVPSLTWFQITGGKHKEHPFLREFETIKYGLSPTDGLVRVAYIEGPVRVRQAKVKADGTEEEVDVPSKGPVEQLKAVMIAEKVTHKALTADDFKLPAEAAKAKWRDSDTGKDIDPPKALIAAKEKPKAKTRE